MSARIEERQARRVAQLAAAQRAEWPELAHHWATLADGFYYAATAAVALTLIVLPERWIDTGSPALGSELVDGIGLGLYALALLMSVVSVVRETREKGAMA